FDDGWGFGFVPGCWGDGCGLGFTPGTPGKGFFCGGGVTGACVATGGGSAGGGSCGTLPGSAGAVAGGGTVPVGAGLSASLVDRPLSASAVVTPPIKTNAIAPMSTSDGPWLFPRPFRVGAGGATIDPGPLNPALGPYAEGPLNCCGGE